MKGRAWKQWSACLLSIAMFAGNAQAVCAAPVAGGEAPAAQVSYGEGITCTTDADGAITISAAEPEQSVGLPDAADTRAVSPTGVAQSAASVAETTAPADDMELPEDPAKDPAEITDPADPAGPTTDPAEGNDPADPTDPAEGDDPGKITDPADPAEEPVVTDPAEEKDPGELPEANPAELTDPEALAGEDALLPVTDDEDPERLTETLASGTDGSLSWTLSDEGVLSITGNGNINDHDPDSDDAPRPWLGYAAQIKAVSLGEGITRIGAYAFYGCSAMATCSIPSSCGSIGEFAFCNCYSLGEITIPAGVATIGQDAFENCVSLTTCTFEPGNTVLSGIPDYCFFQCDSLQSIALPASVRSIGTEAFAGCIMKTVRFGAGSRLETIGDYAFEYCGSLTTITIPRSCTSVIWGGQSSSFHECDGLRAVYVEEGNEAFYSVDGVVYRKSDNTMIFTPMGWDEDPSFRLYRQVYKIEGSIDAPTGFDMTTGRNETDSVNGTPSYIGGFDRWSEVAAFIEDPEPSIFTYKDGDEYVCLLDENGMIPTLTPVYDEGGALTGLSAGTDYPSYTIMINGDQDLKEDPAMPVRAHDLILAGETDGITLSFGGTMTLNSPRTQFRRMKLNAPEGTIAINDNDLILNWTGGVIGSVEGDGTVDDNDATQAAAGGVYVYAAKNNNSGYSWFQSLQEQNQGLSLRFVHGLTDVGTLLVDVQVSGFTILTNAVGGGRDQMAGRYSPVRVGELDYVSGELITGDLIANLKLDAEGSTAGEVLNLRVPEGAVTVKGDAAIDGSRRVYAQTGDIYVAGDLALSGNALVRSYTGSVTVDGRVVMGSNSELPEGTEPGSILSGATGITIGGALVSVCPGNELRYGRKPEDGTMEGSLTLSSGIRVLATEDGEGEIACNKLTHREDVKWAYRAFKAGDAWSESKDAKYPVNALVIVNEALADGYDYAAYAEQLNIVVDHGIGLVEDIDDAKCLNTTLADTAVLFREFQNPKDDPEARFYLSRYYWGESALVVDGPGPAVALMPEGTGKHEEYSTLQEAFAAIDARKDKTAVYTVRINAEYACTDNSASGTYNNTVTPAVVKDGKATYPALKFPTNLAGLTIEGNDDSTPATVYTSGDIKTTYPLTLDSVSIVRWNNTAGQPATTTAKVTVSAGALTIRHAVTFNTPVIFDGGNKAGFTLEEGARLIAAAGAEGMDPAGFLASKLKENDETKALYQPEVGFSLYDDDPDSGWIMGYVEGGFQNFAAVTLYGDRDDSLEAAESFVVAGESAAKSPAFNNIASMSLKDNTMYVMDRAATKGTVKLADLMVDGARFITEGSLNLTTLRLGSSSEVAALEAYNITGTLFNRTQADKNNPDTSMATLTTAQRFKGQGPDATGGAQLNITAAVNRVDADALPIAVRVLGKDAQTGIYDSANLLCGDAYSDAYRRLLAVTNAARDDFVPFAGCVAGAEKLDAKRLLHGGETDLDDENQENPKQIEPYSDIANTWLLSRENKDFVVRSGADLTLLLLKWEDTPGVYDEQLIGAYRTFKEINAVIDARKDLESFMSQYIILLLKDYNCSKDETTGVYTYTPGPVDFPYYTNHLEIRSVDADPDVDGIQPHVLCFSGNLFVRQGVTFTDVRLEPYSGPGVENHAAQLQLRPSFQTWLHHVTGRIGSITGTMETSVWIDECDGLLIEKGISCGEVVADSALTIEDGSLTIGELRTKADKTITVCNGSVTVKKTADRQGQRGLSGEIYLPGGAQLRIPNGSLTAETLDLGTDSLIRVDQGTVTVNGAIDVDKDCDTDSGEHVARIAFPAPGKSKPNFTVKGGIVLHSRDLPLELELLPTGENPLTPGDLTLRLDPKNANKALTTAAYQIADIGTNPSGSVRLLLGNDGCGIDSTDYLPVKAGSMLYLADVREDGGTEAEGKARAVIRPALAKLTRAGTDTYNSCYLDYNSAVKEINALGDRTKTYEIEPGFLSVGVRTVTDLDLTDANKHSALTLPAKDKAAGVTVTGEKTQDGVNGYTFEPIYKYSPVTLWFNGKVSGYGQIGFNGVSFRPCKTGTSDDAGSFDMTVGLNTGEQNSALVFVSTEAAPVSLVADGCSIGKITGVKAAAGKNNATRVVLDHVLLTMTTGFAGAPDVEVDDAAVLTRGKNEIGALIYGSNASFTSYGDLQIARIDLTNAAKDLVWLAGKRDRNGNSTIRVSGEIVWDYAYLPVKLIKEGATGTDKKAGDDLTDDLIADNDYKDKPLLYGPVADAAAVRAFPYRDSLNPDFEVVSYKTPAMYVVNGNKNDMKVLVTAVDPNDKPVMNVYAKSFYEAVQIIDNTGRTDYRYTMELANGEELLTGKPGSNGATFGALVLPAKAAGVTIKGTDDNTACLKFSGGLTAKCPTLLEDLILRSGTGKAGGDGTDFTVNDDGIALDAGTAVAGVKYKLILRSDVYNMTGENGEKQLKVSGIKGSGIDIDSYDRVIGTGTVNLTTLRLAEDTVFENAGAVSLTDLILNKGAFLSTAGEITVKNTVTVTGKATLEGTDPAKKITLGNVAADNVYDPYSKKELMIRYRLKKSAANKPPVSNLKFTGESTIENLVLVPQIWQKAEEGYPEGWYLLADREAKIGGNDPTPVQQAVIDEYNYNLVAQDAAKLIPANRLAEMPKVPAGRVSVRLGKARYATPADDTDDIKGEDAMGIWGVEDGRQVLYKQGGNLFLTTVAPVVQVILSTPNPDGQTSTIRHLGCFASLDEAAKEVDKYGDKVDGKYASNATYTLLQDINLKLDKTNANNIKVAEVVGTPAAKVALPKAIKSLLISGQNHAIAFTGGTFALTCNTMIRNTELVYMKKVGRGEHPYAEQPYAVNLGAWTLDWWTTSKMPLYNMVGKVSGTGKLIVRTQHNEEEGVYEGMKLYATEVSVGQLELQENALLTCTRDITVSGAATLNEGSHLETTFGNGNITVKGTLTQAGTRTAPSRLTAQETISLNDVVLTAEIPQSVLCAGYADAVMQNGQIKTPAVYKITINGTVRCSNPDFAGVADEKSAPILIGGGNVANGSVLVTAAKVPDSWFRPNEALTSEENMFVYKSGKNIITDEGKRAEAEAELYSTESCVDADGAYVKSDGTELTGDRIRSKSDFLSVTEALKEVDTRAATVRLADGIPALNKGVKLAYEDQEVRLLKNVRIENAQKTALAALALPAKAQTLTLSSGMDADGNGTPDPVALKFTGGVTLKGDTVFTDTVDLLSVKSVTEKGQKVEHPTPAAYTLGAFSLTFRGVSCSGHTVGEYAYNDGVCTQRNWSTIGNVTATAGKGRLVLENAVSKEEAAKRLVMTVSGNLNSDVSLQANTQLIAQGSAAMNTLEFGEANRTLQHDWNPGAGIGGGSYGDPHEISCDESPVFTLAGSKALTLGVVLQHGESKFENPRDDNNHYWISTEAVPGILQKRDPSAPMVFKGRKEYGDSRFVHEDFTEDSATEIWIGPETAATVPADLCIFTGAGTVTNYPEHLILRAGDGGNRYNWYTYKDGLYAGNLRPAQP